MKLLPIINKTNSNVYKTNSYKTNYVKSNNNKRLHDVVVFKGKNKFTKIPIEDFISDTYGFFSKEDISKSVLYKQYYSKKCGNDKTKLYNESIALLKKFTELFNSKNVQLVKTKLGMVLDKYPELKLLEKNKLKNILLKRNALQEVLSDMVSIKYLKPEVTFNDIFPTIIYKTVYNDKFKHKYVHPITKGEAILAKFSKEDENKIMKISQKLRKENLITLENKKEMLIDELNDILNSENWLEIGAYSNKQKLLIKNKIIEYYAIKKIIGNNEIFDKDTETIFANRNLILNDLQVGAYIDSEGLVIGKRDVQDMEQKKCIQCTEFLQKENNAFFINLQYLDNQDDMQKFLSLYFSLKDIVKEQGIITNIKQLLEKKASEMINKRKNSIVSSVVFKFDKIDNLPLFYNDIKNRKIIKKTLDEFKEKYPQTNIVAFSADFFNNKSKRFLNAGMYLGYDFLELLRRCNVKNIFLGAKAINSDKPPFPYYLRFGFKPILPNKEVIDNIIKNGTYNDYGECVYMQLNEDAPIWDFAQKRNHILIK